jgi:hypothetical protein
MERAFRMNGSWNEPAGANVVKERSDLVKIYRAVKEKCQKNIDNEFDRVSREVGFVVTTAIPVDLELERGKVKRIRMGSENLNGTIFEKAMIQALKPLADYQIPVDGTAYTIVVLWNEAFMLMRVPVDPGVEEPAQNQLKDMFIKLGDRMATVKEQLHASAIDEVYPELKFAQRLANSKATFRNIQSNAILSNLDSAQKRFL